MSFQDLLLQQIINGVSLGAMYSLLALGFTMVYGIIELINFAHFNVFMVGAFFSMWILKLTGLAGQKVILTGLPLVGVLLLALVCVMLFCGVLGVAIERTVLRPLRNVPGTAAMITTIGVSYILFNVILLSQGAAALNFPNPMPAVVWNITAGAVLKLREVLLWTLAGVLMLGLHFFVRRTRMGKAMQATAQDQEAARMMGIEVDSVVMTTFFLGSALAGAAGLVFGLYYNFASYVIGYTAGLRAFTAAVLGGIGNTIGAALGGFIIGFIEVGAAVAGYNSWGSAIVFGVLVLVLVFRPAGLLGQQIGERA